jgi:hypothetical protein
MEPMDSLWAPHFSRSPGFILGLYEEVGIALTASLSAGA